METGKVNSEMAQSATRSNQISHITLDMDQESGLLVQPMIPYHCCSASNRRMFTIQFKNADSRNSDYRNYSPRSRIQPQELRASNQLKPSTFPIKTTAESKWTIKIILQQNKQRRWCCLTLLLEVGEAHGDDDGGGVAR